MTLISYNIDQVKVFPLPTGISEDGSNIQTPGFALVCWHSNLEGKLFQVYVNKRYAGTTVNEYQRRLVVGLVEQCELPIKIEVFGIEPELFDEDFSDEVSSNCVNGQRVRIIMQRGQNLPSDVRYSVYSNNGNGEVDYEKAITKSSIPVWSSWLDKAGFGMSCFGLSDFGWDAAGTVGFGKGSFGYNKFGIDADTIEWIRNVLIKGTYKFGVQTVDKYGNKGIASETIPVTVIPLAKSASNLEIKSFNKNENQLVLKISDSP